MKVVLFCGGYGMRMRDGTSSAPKPMVMVGSRPLIWHVMRYYAHFGHTEFILCLGYGAHHIKEYFLNYQETYSNDFVMTDGGRSVELLSTDISDWTISFVDTGLKSPIGERLRRVRHLLGDDEVFMANYADVLTDAPLNEMVANLERSDAVASMIAVPPQSAFHCLQIDESSHVTDVRSVSTLDLWENGGYFVLRTGIFDYLFEGADLVQDGCGSAAKDGRLLAYPYRGFWHPADTVKERAALEEAYENGYRPWMVWLDDEASSDILARASHDLDAR
ncbi:glucose-1-phosphate cytidylyltransferase [Jatrophihabitans sp. GAS493]|uniref:sugar phosphate nucleotidyltransferase n=1 Tax=Jatrophihabitans sp. GAS493 TaxID=1907575 RepID=UPI000BB9B143|nr:sugar phosphate nucleotidyltransferase [Jatrophihabitans sp. GAS493]SOD75209.1 glucose-1-phosphate cytidylyltransferase [Jatrophihabitans sp. GAS493]